MNYLIQPQFHCNERNADYEAAKRINDTWESVADGSSCAYRKELIFDNVEKRFRFETEEEVKDGMWLWEQKEKRYFRIFETISAAFGYYRTICLFDNPIVSVEGSAGYKLPMWLNFKHKKTGAILAIREWKGAFGFGLGYEDLPTGGKTPTQEQSKALAQVEEDIIFFFNTLVSDTCPHSYDGLVAGSVA